MACGFILAGGDLASPSTLAEAEAICLVMGEYFQVQVRAMSRPHTWDTPKCRCVQPCSRTHDAWYI